MDLKSLLMQAFNIDETKANNILSQVNYDNIYATELSKLTYRIWDKKSPINGVNADVILQSRNDIVGETYLIEYEGNIIYIQGHKPYIAGYVPMTIDEIPSIVESHMQEVAEKYAINKFLEEAGKIINTAQ